MTLQIGYINIGFISRAGLSNSISFFRAEQALTPGSMDQKRMYSKKRNTFLTQAALWSYADDLAEYGSTLRARSFVEKQLQEPAEGLRGV